MKSIEDFENYVMSSNYDSILQISIKGVIDDYKSSIERNNEAKAVRQNEQTQEVCEQCNADWNNAGDYCENDECENYVGK